MDGMRARGGIEYFTVSGKNFFVFLFYSLLQLRGIKKFLKRPGEISQIIMFNPNSTWTLDIKIWVVCFWDLFDMFKVHVVWLVFS